MIVATSEPVIKHTKTYWNQVGSHYTPIGAQCQPTINTFKLTCRLISHAAPMRSLAFPCHGMSYHAMPCHARAYHAMPWHGMAYHVMPCHAMAFHTTPRHDISGHGISLLIMVWHGMASHCISWYGMAYHAMPCHGFPCLPMPLSCLYVVTTC